VRKDEGKHATQGKEVKKILGGLVGVKLRLGLEGHRQGRVRCWRRGRLWDCQQGQHRGQHRGWG